MKTLLMFRDHDFDLEAAAPPNAQTLTQDLELDTLCGGMARGDDFLLSVARQAVLCSVQDPDLIRYRQRILQDCLKNPLVVRRIYDLAVDTIEAERKNYWPIMRIYPDSVLRRSVDVMQMLVAMLRKLTDDRR